MRLLSLFWCVVVLNNCAVMAAIPPAVQFLSTGTSVVSFATTGKGPSEHLLSAMIEKDCAIYRVVTEDDICLEIEDGAIKQKYAGNIDIAMNTVER